jgi:outer membrane protein TolC
LTLADAVARAQAGNPQAGISAAAEREAGHRLVEARAGYWPKVDFTESWQRGNQPVFVFGSLLAQRRFSAADFTLDALNHPDPADNFRSSVAIEQAILDPTSRAGVSVADIGAEVATTERAAVRADLATAVTAAYGRVIVAASAQQAAAASVERARSNRELAGNRRDAGLVTDSDVLQVDVFVAGARAEAIRAESEERIARAQLNQLMGEPLDASFRVDAFESMPAMDTSDRMSLETEALAHRPAVELARLRERLAVAKQREARAPLLPQVAAQGTWELNGEAWSSRASSWVVGAVARVSVFRGFADKARLAEAGEQQTRMALERQAVENQTRLEVLEAIARLDAARASEAVGRTALDQARESRRILRDRYEAGVSDVASLLRADDILRQAELQQTTARVAMMTAAATLAQTLGR